MPTKFNHRSGQYEIIAAPTDAVALLEAMDVAVQIDLGKGLVQTTLVDAYWRMCGDRVVKKAS